MLHQRLQALQFKNLSITHKIYVHASYIESIQNEISMHLLLSFLIATICGETFPGISLIRAI